MYVIDVLFYGDNCVVYISKSLIKVYFKFLFFINNFPEHEFTITYIKKKVVT